MVKRQAKAVVLLEESSGKRLHTMAVTLLEISSGKIVQTMAVALLKTSSRIKRQAGGGGVHTFSVQRYGAL